MNYTGANISVEEEKRIIFEAHSRYSGRLFDLQTAADYIGLGRTRAREWLTSIGAVRKFGSRVLFDRTVIDSALDALGDVNEEKVV